MRPTFEELTQYREGEVTQARAAEIERELEHSQELRAELARVDGLIAALQRADPALAGVDLREGIALQLARPARTAWPRRALIGTAALAAALAVAVLVPRGSTDEARPKGGPFEPCGLEVFVRDGDAARRPAATIAKDAALGFAYRNLEASPYRWLMIYAVDSRGGVEWYYPAWTDAAANPGSIAVGVGVAPIALPEAVQHELPAGALKIHALFTTRARTVREVEAQLSHGEGFDPSEARDVVVSLSVR